MSLRKTANLQDSGCSLGGNAKSTRRGKKWDKVCASATIFLPKWAKDMRKNLVGLEAEWKAAYTIVLEKSWRSMTALKIWLWGDLFYDIYWLNDSGYDKKFTNQPSGLCLSYKQG